MNLKPYKNPDNNRIEMLAILAGIMTLYCAIVFVIEVNSLASVYNLSLVLLFIVNGYFILQWTFLLCCSIKYDNKYFNTFLNIYATMLREKVRKEEGFGEDKIK